MADLAIGLVGAGRFARLHARALRDIPGCHIAAVCDPVPEALESASRWTGDVPRYGALAVSAEGERDPKPRYAISIDFGSAPERQEALTKALFAQLDTLERKGPSAETLAKVKEADVRSRETSLRQNPYWLSQLVTFDRLGWPLAEIPAGDRLISALDAKTVQDAARRYLNDERYVKVVLLPGK